MKRISTCAFRTMRSEEVHVFGGLDGVTYTVCGLRAQHDGSEMMVRVAAESPAGRETKTLVLRTEQYLTIRPEVGAISEETYERLEEAAELCAAVRAGEALLSYGSNTVAALAKKLTQRGYSRAVALAAGESLAARGLINEQSDLRREVERSLSKLWGPKRIKAHLWSRGFDAEALEALPDILAEIDFVAVCAALIQKHYVQIPEEEAERRRMISFLSRYGYSIGEIREALAALRS